MACLSFRTPVFSLVTSFCLVGAGLVFSAGPAAAATCPTVDPGTGAVSPAPFPGVQWPGCDLTGANLASGDISGGNLFGANLTNADLTGAVLTSTDLMSADLTNANLTDADLKQAMLSGTTMAGATLTGVSSGFISGTPASLPSGWILANNYLVGPGANLQFAGLSGSDLTNADLSNADLTNAKLAQVTLTGATLTGATLTGVMSGGIVGTPASLPQNWSVKAGYLLGPGAVVGGATLSNLDLSGLTLTGISSALAYSCPSNWILGLNVSLTEKTNSDLFFAKFKSDVFYLSSVAFVFRSLPVISRQLSICHFKNPRQVLGAP